MNIEGWKKKLIKQPKRDVVDGIMVRPVEETRKWLTEIATQYNVSVNKVVLAIIETARENEKKS